MLGAVRGVSNEILGEEKRQKVTDLGGAPDIDQSPWGDVTCMFHHQASCTHTGLGRFEEQKPLVRRCTSAQQSKCLKVVWGGGEGGEGVHIG